MPCNILITGCSGGGKTTLLDALAHRGHCVVSEPGLRVVKDQVRQGGQALPWQDMPAFLARSAALARADLAHMSGKPGLVFYDRGLLDAAVALLHVCGTPMPETLGGAFPYAQPVILAPPWRSIYAETDERRHQFAEAVAEHDRISAALATLGREVVALPLASVSLRVQFVESIVRAKPSYGPDPKAQT